MQDEPRDDCFVVYNDVCSYAISTICLADAVETDNGRNLLNRVTAYAAHAATRSADLLIASVVTLKNRIVGYVASKWNERSRMRLGLQLQASELAELKEELQRLSDEYSRATQRTVSCEARLQSTELRNSQLQEQLNMTKTEGVFKQDQWGF